MITALLIITAFRLGWVIALHCVRESEIEAIEDGAKRFDAFDKFHNASILPLFDPRKWSADELFGEIE